MSQSSLVSYRDYSARHWNDRRGNGVKRIVIHHCAGVLSVEQLGNIFRNKQGSSTYGIGYDGRVGQYVPEEYRPWTTSGWEPDRNCITIEVSNSAVGGNWPVSDKVLGVLINLVTDICRRNGLTLNYTGDKRGNLLMHKWYAATACPGPYLASKFPYIASEVNKRLRSSATVHAPAKPAAPVQTSAIHVGDMVRPNSLVDYNGRSLRSYYSVYSVAEINGDRAVLKAGGQVWAAMKVSNLTKVGETSAPAQSAPKKSVGVGSTVRLRNGAKTYTGGSLASFVYGRTYKVSELKGDRAVITYGGTVVAAVHVSDLTAV